MPSYDKLCLSVHVGRLHLTTKLNKSGEGTASLVAIDWVAIEDSVAGLFVSDLSLGLSTTTCVHCNTANTLITLHTCLLTQEHGTNNGPTNS